jgi:hypothetical protein
MMRRSQPPKRAAVADTRGCGGLAHASRLAVRAFGRTIGPAAVKSLNTSLTAPPGGPALAAPASGSSAGAPAVRCGCRASRCAERGVHRLAVRAPASQAEPGVADERRGRYWQLPCGHCRGRSRAGWPLYRRPLCRGQHALLQGAAQGAPAAPAAPGRRGAWLVAPWRTEGRPPGMRFGSAN